MPFTEFFFKLLKPRILKLICIKVPEIVAQHTDRFDIWQSYFVQCIGRLFRSLKSTHFSYELTSFLVYRSKCSSPFGFGVRSTSTTSSCRLPSTAPGRRGTLTSTTARGKFPYAVNLSMGFGGILNKSIKSFVDSSTAVHFVYF